MTPVAPTRAMDVAEPPKSSTSGLVVSALFVVLWSSGYVAGTFGVRAMGPLALTFWRFLLAATVLGLVAFIRRAPWPRGPRVIAHLAATGITLQAVQGIGVYLGLQTGVPAGTTAMIMGIGPVVIALAARATLREHFTARQRAGSLLGIVGVGVVLGPGVPGNHLGPGVGFTVLGLAGFATGTLCQKRFGATAAMSAGACVQYSFAAIAVLPVALLDGGLHFPLTVASLAPLSWLTLVNSIAAVLLLFALLKRGNAGSISSLFYLVPPVTALLAAAMLGQHLTVTTGIGLAVTAIGVLLVTRTN